MALPGQSIPEPRIAEWKFHAQLAADLCSRRDRPGIPHARAAHVDFRCRVSRDRAARVLAGGIRYKEQRVNATAARVESTLLTLAAIALIMPAAFHYLSGPAGRIRENDLSLEISVVLLVAYAANLLFSLRTHKQLFMGE